MGSRTLSDVPAASPWALTHLDHVSAANMVNSCPCDDTEDDCCVEGWGMDETPSSFKPVRHHSCSLEQASRNGAVDPVGRELSYLMETSFESLLGSAKKRRQQHIA